MATEYKKPHFGNLQARAKRLGLIITRMTTDEDARMIGGHEFVLTKSGATNAQKDNARLYSLNGIARCVEEAESIAAAKKPVENDAARPAETVSVPSHEFHMVGESKSARRDTVSEAIEILERAVKFSGDYRVSSMEKIVCGGDKGRIELLNELARKRASSFMAEAVSRHAEVLEFESEPLRASWDDGEKDTVFRAQAVVMTVDQYRAVMAVLRNTRH